MVSVFMCVEMSQITLNKVQVDHVVDVARHGLQQGIYLEVITWQFSYRPVYQGRASIISPRRKPRADDDRDLDIGSI